LSRRQTAAGRERDAAIEAIRAVGRRRWKKDAGYHAQARAENTFFRYKRLLGPHVRSRGRGAQQLETRLACAILNKMLELGAARSVPVVS